MGRVVEPRLNAKQVTGHVFDANQNSAFLEVHRHEAKGQPPAPAWEKLPKAELAKEVERQIAGTGWMPLPLRSA